MGLVSKDDGWRVPDPTWERMVRLLPTRPSHPLGCHNPRVPDRRAMDAILLVLRTGMQWNALNGTGICTSSSAHRRFQEWVEAGVFAEFWRQGLLATTSCRGSSGSGSPATARSARRRSAATLLARTRLTERKRGETLRRLRRWWPPDRARDRRREHQRLQAPPRDPHEHPDRAAGRRGATPVGSLPGQGLRLPGGVRARRRTRLHPAHSRAGRREESARTRPRLPCPPLGDRAYPLLAEPIPRPTRALVEEARKPPRPSPTRLRNHRLANGDRRDPSGIGS